MDSFFSLFDPADGQSKPRKTKYKDKEDNVKKKTDGVVSKGRRRGRKAQGKNETLPEESSFLCEPDLSTELLKDRSYIESYIEVNRKDEDTKDADKKPKRRNSGRKNRRKKKVSPSKDLVPNNGWSQETGLVDTDIDTNMNNGMNNLVPVPKLCVDNLGKNVNDLNEFKRVKRKNSDAFEERAVYNVIDKLEKVGFKDDVYLAGEFSTEELENDLFYNSDEMDDSVDDTSSETEDSSSSSYGCLPPEPRFGNVEYKLRLVCVCDKRFQHLVTQLKWRLRSGGGSAIYVLGVRDCGALVGLRARALRASLVTLWRMARALRATVAHCTPRRVAPHRAVAEVYIRKLAECQRREELRVAVMGANEAGKSTLIGVLTQGELDNGRGSARLNMFRHLHEVKSGRTSSLSHEILGFDAQGNVVNYGCSELMTAERIGERSAKLVSFLDLAGHTKYQRTTLHGLTGYSPHYAIIVISATAGITPITEEHLTLLSALELPFSVVVAKCELAPTAVPQLVRALAALMTNKKPVVITDEAMARNCVAPKKLILDSVDGKDDVDNEDCRVPIVPVFPVSCVRGAGLRALHAYLVALSPPAPGPLDGGAHTADETCEFQIDEIFHVGQTTGPVVGGLLARGQLVEGDHLIIGPLDTGEFVPCSVKTIYRNRVPHDAVRAGHCASLGLSHSPPGLRAGMVLLSPRTPTGLRPTFGGCAPGTCIRNKQVKDILKNKQHHENAKNRKNVRRKNKNLLSDLAKVESSLVKDNSFIEESNIYHSDSDQKVVEKRCDTEFHFDKRCDAANNFNERCDTENNFNERCDTKNSFNERCDTENSVDNRCDTEKDFDVDSSAEKESDDENCGCCDEVFLEDPNNPRGCIYFQATIHVLRHSTAICPGFQCSVHVGNVRQTAIIEGIMSRNNELRLGQSASAVFRFARCPEYLVRGRRMLLTAGLGTRAIGRITQIFPFYP